MDAFRKKANDTLYYQLNIDTQILGGALARTSGVLFLYNNPLIDTKLDEGKSDSVAQKRGLNYLIRRQ